ncbi:PEGA domain-containing protein [Sorangium sp. So ce291]|uniref:PEGA domain-containing protein n=1 Tax=Sorangium sp. So ce291 TaxID=3133294 RepID=UPI003F632A9E
MSIHARTRPVVALLLVGLCAASVAEPALAQTHDSVAAEALFVDGRAAADRGDFEAARVRFAESHRLDPSAGALFNLAYAEEKVERIASAWQHYREVAGQLAPGDRRLAFAQQRVAALEPKLPRLTVRPSAPLPAGARVTRDGVALGTGSLGTALPADPGRHEVVVSAPGRGDRRYEVTLRKAESTELLVELAPPSAAPAPVRPAAVPTSPAPVRPAAVSTSPAPRRPAPPAPGGDLRPLGWAIGSAGLVGLTLGAVAGAMTFAQKSTMRDHCDADLLCDQEGLDASHAGPVWATVSTVAFAVGAAGTGVGVYLVLRGGKSEPRREASGSRPSATLAAVGVSGAF